MNCPSTAVVDVRLGRKRFSISGSLLSLLILLLALVMLVTQTSARPQTANETATHNNVASLQQQKSDANYNDDNSAELAFDAGDEYADVDNVEWHHVKIVDGIMHEDHPIIMYKEDFVSEDYDPSQHTTTITNGNTETHTQQQPRRKYKNIKRQNRLNRNDTDTDTADTVIAAATSSSDSYSTDSSKISKEKYHALKPEKIYFDILPQSPVVLTDDASSNDSKFEPSRIHVEVISLLDEEQQEQAKHDDDAKKSSSAQQEQGQGQQSKQLLNKHPKKYHHHEHKQRSRRDLTAVELENEEAQQQADEHKLHKRTPHYTYERQGPNSFDVYAKHLMNYWTQKHPVAGNRWNGIDGDVPPFVDFDNRFGGEDNTDRVVWGVSKKITRPVNRPFTTRRPAPVQPNFPPLMHNSNPEDADFSAFTPSQNNFINNNNNNRRPAPATRPPAQQPQFPSIFHNSNPNDADFSVFTKRPPTTTRPAPNNAISTGGGASSLSSSSSSSSSPSSSSSAAISQCVWAIVNCCSTSDTNIRYECFGRLGCPGAFWNLNPCADDVKDKVLEFVDRQFQ